MSEAAWRLALLLSWARMKEGLFNVLYVFLHDFDGKLGIFISFAKKKRSKESCPGYLLFPAFTSIKRAQPCCALSFC